jgi:GNAT superfamily N-acetyltransferase
VGAVRLDVRVARAEDVFPLRHAVLRPGRPVSASVYATDADAVHVGAWDDGTLVGCATVFPDPWPGPPPEPGAWRLRGMAVDPSYQRGGVGRAVLAVAGDAARRAGAPLLWANARSTAVGFYERLGWRVVGPEFETADTGLPHKPMLLDLG